MPLVAAHNLEYTAFIFTLLERSLQLHNFIASFMLSLPQVKKKQNKLCLKWKGQFQNLLIHFQIIFSYHSISFLFA